MSTPTQSTVTESSTHCLAYSLLLLLRYTLTPTAHKQTQSVEFLSGEVETLRARYDHSSETCQLLQLQAVELEDKYEDTVGTLVRQATVQSGVHTALQLMLAAKAGAEVAATSAAVTLLTNMHCGPADCDTPTPYELYELDSSSSEATDAADSSTTAVGTAAGAAAAAGDSHNGADTSVTEAKLSIKLSAMAISTESDSSSSAATVRRRVPKTASSVSFSDDHDDTLHANADNNNSSYSSGGSKSSSNSSRGGRSNSANDFTGYVDSYVEDCDELPVPDATATDATNAATDAASSALVCVNTEDSCAAECTHMNSTAAAVTAAGAAASAQATAAHTRTDSSSTAAVLERRDIMQLLHAIGESHRAATVRHLTKTERLTRELHEARAEAGV
eukprot:9787-Heterococcus_DN1.PRE.1